MGNDFNPFAFFIRVVFGCLCAWAFLSLLVLIDGIFF